MIRGGGSLGVRRLGREVRCRVAWHDFIFQLLRRLRAKKLLAEKVISTMLVNGNAGARHRPMNRQVSLPSCDINAQQHN